MSSTTIIDGQTDANSYCSKQIFLNIKFVTIF